MLKDSARVGVYKDGLIVKANMLAEKNGELHPLYRLDTIYTRRLLHTNDNATMLQRGVDKMLDKVKNKNAAVLKISKRSLSYDDISGYVRNKFNIPILLTNEYKKGYTAVLMSLKTMHHLSQGTRLLIKANLTHCRDGIKIVQRLT